MEIRWEIKTLQELSSLELYCVIQLRIEVFIIEQNCIYRDCDNKDQFSQHLMGWHQDKLVAYARLIPEGISYPERSIGRVLVHQEYRNYGIGKELMVRALCSLCSSKELPQPIKISAQFYLKRFYESLGFRQTSPEYLEDNIPHIEMLCSELKKVPVPNPSNKKNSIPNPK